MIIVKIGRNILISIVLLTSIILTTIVYSAFSTQLQISGEAIVRSDNDIRVTNVKVLSQTNNAYETYNSKYTKDTTSMFVTLPGNSTITYEVEITDKVNVGYIMESIEEMSNTNSNINIDIGLSQYDLINSNSTKKFNISFTNTTNEEQISTLVLKYHFLENRFIVTFDANGGNVDTLTKEVAWGSNYGELPTPTRDGYTFKGWNGKNLFDIESILLPLGNYENEYYVFRLGSAHSKYGTAGKKIPILNLKENTRYTLTLIGYVEECTSSTCSVGFTTRLIVNPNYDDGSYEMYPLNEIEEVKKIYTTAVNKSVSFFQMSYGTGGVTNAYIKKVQLEEGNISTEWEPYYVTNDIKVTQMKNHTLTAIWEEN